MLALCDDLILEGAPRPWMAAHHAQQLAQAARCFVHDRVELSPCALPEQLLRDLAMPAEQTVQDFLGAVHVPRSGTPHHVYEAIRHAAHGGGHHDGTRPLCTGRAYDASDSLHRRGVRHRGPPELEDHDRRVGAGPARSLRSVRQPSLHSLG